MAKKEKKKKKDEAEEAAAADATKPEGEAGADGEAPKKKKLAGKQLVLFIILPAILVLGAGGGAAFMLMQNGGPAAAHASSDSHGKEKAKGKGKEGEHGAAAVAGANGVMITQGEGVVFVALPEMLVNITAADGRPAYLKLKLTLEAPDYETVAALEPEIPRITDQFNVFLRELRTDDLTGSAGAYRLRLELLRRVNLVAAPKRINAVLIEEMLVQ